ncbi:hypothetical protein E0Z10_g4883 [Xylaria hypoxylon]|uniref:T6SS Phospholipase effector Tle1-like catalytic domain-containing protein n=1 Tax=Xylaria hypoxylon TaxID=37992 RepID=A0A4Z0YJ51_9PEZI|nr:hypothetical protein E0Z10_g4883 [Xylaria hypoxylon]
MRISNVTKEAAPIRKRLFVFCDGTWQDALNGKRPPTNVVTLARCIEGVADDNYLQVVYYDNGVGNATNLYARLVEGATGRGMSSKIRNAYSFLSHNYNFDNEGDEIFLIGYSRGAFAVQCLASFISDTGLLHKRYLYYLRGLFKLWANRDLTPICHPGKTPLKSKLERHVRDFQAEKLLSKVKIKACVVWDTVSNLGLPTPWAKPLSFVGGVIPQGVENAFQALALDETRAQFKPCVWNAKEASSTYAKQCWFLGSHADVGGNGDAALGAVALIWIIGQLQEISGVTFNQDEIMKHLKHRLLEWDVDVNPILGKFKQTTVLSRRSSLGLSTKSSPLWWLSGFKRRQLDIGFGHDQSNLESLKLVHFTVRLSMFQDRNTCRVLVKWGTKMENDGRVYWKRCNGTLVEDTLQGNDADPGHEYAILKDWCNSHPPLLRTDRSRFAARLQALTYDPEEGMESRLGLFAELLRYRMIFDEDNLLAPESMYRPLARWME